jgi:Cys-tRNA(Pro)/Cys-tRNA(Cys) deacylase
MSKTTRATQALEKLGVKFTLHAYDYDPDAASIGLQAAEALGVAPARVLKTLMAEVDGKPVCAVVPSDCEVSMKKLAGAFAAKTAKMMRPADAERLTSYHIGGISPFGQKKRVPVAIEEAALSHTSVFLNGGQPRLAGRTRSPGRREGGGRDRARTGGVSGLRFGFGKPLPGECGLRLRP